MRVALPILLGAFLFVPAARAADVVTIASEQEPVSVTVPMRPVVYYILPGSQPTAFVASESRVTLKVTEGLPEGTVVQWYDRGSLVTGVAGREYELGVVGPTRSGYYQSVIKLPGGSSFSLAIQLEIIDPRQSSRLLNTSLRATITPDAPRMIGGVVVSANRGHAVLVRAVGPALADFGVTVPLADPQIQLFDAAGNPAEKYILAVAIPELDPASGPRRAAEQVGAFPLREGAGDVALLVAFPPGVYTAHVTSASGGTGEVLLEFYDVPKPVVLDYLVPPPADTFP